MATCYGNTLLCRKNRSNGSVANGEPQTRRFAFHDSESGPVRPGVGTLRYMPCERKHNGSIHGSVVQFRSFSPRVKAPRFLSASAFFLDGHACSAIAGPSHAADRRRFLLRFQVVRGGEREAREGRLRPAGQDRDNLASHRVDRLARVVAIIVA